MINSNPGNLLYLCMKLKVAKKDADKSKEPFMGILTPEQISEGAAKFRKEVNAKIRLKTTKS
jgi:hypothetical protein